jgi:hypothetical protein
MLCNDAEYKNMDQDESWSVVRCTDSNKDLLQAIWLCLFISYDKTKELKRWPGVCLGKCFDLTWTRTLFL